MTGNSPHRNRRSNTNADSVVRRVGGNAGFRSSSSSLEDPERDDGSGSGRRGLRHRHELEKRRLLSPQRLTSPVVAARADRRLPTLPTFFDVCRLARTRPASFRLSKRRRRRAHSKSDSDSSLVEFLPHGGVGAAVSNRPDCVARNGFTVPAGSSGHARILGTTPERVQFTLGGYLVLLGMDSPSSARSRIGLAVVRCSSRGPSRTCLTSLALGWTHAFWPFVLLRVGEATAGAAMLVATFPTVRDVYAERARGARGSTA